jgi:hypothetical protein
MVTSQMQVLARHGLEWMGWRAILSPGGRQSKPVRHLLLIKQLPPDFETQKLTEGRRNGVANLPVSRSPASHNVIAIRERL